MLAVRGLVCWMLLLALTCDHLVVSTRCRQGVSESAHMSLLAIVEDPAENVDKGKAERLIGMSARLGARAVATPSAGAGTDAATATYLTRQQPNLRSQPRPR